MNWKTLSSHKGLETTLCTSFSCLSQLWVRDSKTALRIETYKISRSQSTTLTSKTIREDKDFSLQKNKTNQQRRRERAKSSSGSALRKFAIEEHFSSRNCQKPEKTNKKPLERRRNARNTPDPIHACVCKRVTSNPSQWIKCLVYYKTTMIKLSKF